MYLPEHFEETDQSVLSALIAEHPLGMIITLGSEGLTANPIPFLFEPGHGERGRLVGHVARKNALWHDHRDDLEALVIFQGVSTYISPNWYVTKQVTHQVVPTYNYAVVQVHGPLVIHEDAKWLRGVVGKLTKTFEAHEDVPWRMSDAPSDFITAQLGNIVGIEIPISRMVGKWKTSQNRPVEDRRGVVAGLSKRKRRGDVAMADLVLSQLRGTDHE